MLAWLSGSVVRNRGLFQHPGRARSGDRQCVYDHRCFHRLESARSLLSGSSLDLLGAAAKDPIRWERQLLENECCSNVSSASMGAQTSW